MLAVCWSFPLFFSARKFVFGTPRAFFGALLPRSSTSSASASWNTNNLVISHPVLAVMETCSSMWELKQIQGHMTRTGLMIQRFPASRILAFCVLSDCGDLEHGQRVFANMDETNTYIWNTMIRAYSRWGIPFKAFDLFQQMTQEGVEVDNRTFVFALKACEFFPNTVQGEGVHCLIFKLGLALDLLVTNGLMHFYVKYGLLDRAQDLFDSSPYRDVVSWTTMIDGYAQTGLAFESIRMFRLMLSQDVLPNEVTVITVLSACSQAGLLDSGRTLHGYTQRRNMNMTANLQNAILDMYCKCSCIGSAREIFDKMEKKDVFSWTSMVNGYAKCGKLEVARGFFDEMPVRNVVSWSTMIAGYSQANQPNEALDLFNEMIAAGLYPIDATLVSVLSACGQSGRLGMGKWVHQCFIVHDATKLKTTLANALINMYARSGVISAASKLFDQMPEKDIVSWNSMILAYAVHGHCKEALVLFEKMKSMGYVPDSVTMIGVLSACSHGGLVIEGQKYFCDMKILFGLEPKTEHYACIIDLLGRVGLLEDAAQLIESMLVQPDKAAWGALLNACRIHGNVELGKCAAEKLMTLDPGDSGIYTLLSNLYAARKRWSDVKMVRRMMRECGIRKAPGCSSVEVDGKLHEFFAADKSHYMSDEIYNILDLVYLQLSSKEYIETSGWRWERSMDTTV